MPPWFVQEVFIENCMSVFFKLFSMFCFVRCFVFDFLYKDLIQLYDSTTNVFRCNFFLNIQLKRVSRSGFLTVFGKILAFVPAYFSGKIWIKKVLRKGFLTVFGKILVFVPAFGETLVKTHQTWRKMTLK